MHRYSRGCLVPQNNVAHNRKLTTPTPPNMETDSGHLKWLTFKDVQKKKPNQGPSMQLELHLCECSNPLPFTVNYFIQPTLIHPSTEDMLQ